MNFLQKLIFLLFLHCIQASLNTPCILRQNKIKSILRGKYQNLLSIQSNALLSTARLNYFAGGFHNSIPTRDAIYMVNWSVGFTFCALNQSIEFRTIQSYQINTVFLRLWDGSNRTYNFQVFISYNGVEKLIYDSITASGNINLKFQDQYVDKIRFYNRGGNTENVYLILIKVEAIYKF
ncbi:unnamed protein product [Paramecium pentaurelia]|uniref:Uncharacterized protein n=1 Tax=Paramecium pentaurelia TaxID=43138 RepID=A0A8S1SF24_9CILI|nr:unnamed protein product [Paramecium pentaurelia]